MKPIQLIASVFSVAVLIAGCNKDELNIMDGTYTGTFTVRYSSGTQTGPTTLNLQDGKFSCQGNPNRIPAGGSGTFFADSKTITFQDENVWTADFDWNLILSGQYNYTFNGKKLKIFADKNQVGYYEYDLEKQ